MKIAFDVTPLVGDLVSGIGWCESGLITSMGQLHPEHTYHYQYFSLRGPEVKKERLKPHCLENTILQPARFSPLIYRTLSTFLPVPYSAFFGKEAEITHFFNYIIPPGVSGKKVVTVHDMVIHAFPETVRFRTKQMLKMGLEKSMKRADRIITDSEFSRKEIEKYYPRYADKVDVVYCGVNLQRFYPRSQEEMDTVRKKYHLEEPYILYLGTLEPRKNLERLIEAYRMFSEGYDHPPKLVLAGGKGWMYGPILEKVQSKDLENRVILTEYIPSADLPALLSAAECFAFPSLYEGFGMPPLEAMACGTPVLTSNAASLPEVVGDCAIMTDPYSCEAIAEGLSKIHEDAELRKTLSVAGLERVKSFTWNLASEKLYSIYEDLLK